MILFSNSNFKLLEAMFWCALHRFFSYKDAGCNPIKEGGYFARTSGQQRFAVGYIVSGYWVISPDKQAGDSFRAIIRLGVISFHSERFAAAWTRR